LSGGTFTNEGDVLTLKPGASAITATLTGTALTKLTLLGEGATIAIPAAATAGLVLEGVLVDLSAAGSIAITQGGKLLLGTPNDGASHAAGIITAYNGTGKVVVAGGAESGAITDNDNVAAFNEKADYAAIVMAIDEGVGVQGVITAAGEGKNNAIDKDDTFALDTDSPNLVVTHP
jgi:hypothetical protein